MRALGKAAIGLLTITGIGIGYLALLRPRLNRWGATNREVDMTLPGDELTPGDADKITHVLDIDADVEVVWPWLLQIGRGRGGFYSYSWLENAVGSQIRNVSDLNSSLQELREGDTITLHPKVPPLRVSNLDAPNNIVLFAEDVVTIGHDGKLQKFVWSFHLRPHGRGSCRLIARVRVVREPGLLSTLGQMSLEPGHFLFERKMMLTIKALAERAKEPKTLTTQRNRPIVL